VIECLDTDCVDRKSRMVGEIGFVCGVSGIRNYVDGRNAFVGKKYGSSSCCGRMISQSKMYERSGCGRSRFVKRISVKCSVNDSNMDEVCETSENSSGSIIGPMLFISGCAVGAGMLSLPARTVSAGVIPAEVTMIAAAFFNIVSSLTYLQVTHMVRNETEPENRSSISLISLAQHCLDSPQLANFAIWLVKYALIECYVVQGGDILSQLVHSDSEIVHTLSSTAFSGLLAALICFGSPLQVDWTNRILVLGLGIFFSALMGTLVFSCVPADALTLPSINAWISDTHWDALWPASVSVCLIAFQSQAVVPIALEMVKGDVRKAQVAIALGHFLPLIMYSIWNGLLLRISFGNQVVARPSPIDTLLAMVSTGDSASFTQFLVLLALGFSFCAIGSSFVGVGSAFRDMLKGLLISSDKTIEPKQLTETSASNNPRDTADAAASALNWKVFGLLMTPAVLSLSGKATEICSFILDHFGLIGALSVNGILPGLMLNSLRKKQQKERALTAEQNENQEMTPAGSLPLTVLMSGALMTASAALLIPESIRIMAPALKPAFYLAGIE